MQEELLQESGEQMLARVEYALRQEHAAVSWGLPVNGHLKVHHYGHLKVHHFKSGF